MKTRLPIPTIIAAWMLSQSLLAQVPQLITYQGHVTSNATPFDGTGHFKFALVNFGGTTFFWRNDGSNSTVGEPADSVNLKVSAGLFTAILGNTNTPGMAAIPPGIFVNPNVHIRVWFSDNGTTFTQLSPDPRITAAGYALMADDISDGAITTSKLAAGAITPGKLADGAVTGTKIAAGAVTSATLADSLALGATNKAGKLEVYRTEANTPAVSILGGQSQISVNGKDGTEKVHIEGQDWGTMWVNNNLASNDRAVTIGINNASGGIVTVYDPKGQARANLGANADNTFLTLLQADGDSGVTIDSDVTDSHGGEIFIYDKNGTSTVELRGAESASTGAQLMLRQANGSASIQLDGEFNAGGGGLLRLYKGDGSTGITLQADASGESKITTQVIQITGGADLSEQFDINATRTEAEPGTLVCIDSQNPGQLVVSAQAYDRTVAGIVSGAGGVKPGMMMGQQGSVANGKHPVALSGRVYCKADAANGSIRPGDLLTTSNTPGHAMKVADYDHAHGAIIGKAMSALEQGKGLVLVLVSLQ
jgi:hypothetical protein